MVIIYGLNIFNDAMSNIRPDNYETISYFTTYPKGRRYNEQFFIVTIPIATYKYTVKITEAYVYDINGDFIDIKSDCVEILQQKCYVNLHFTYIDNQSGKLLRIDLLFIRR